MFLQAAGLGHEEVIRAILSSCPEALSRTDREGRTALHYAAAAKGSGTSYDTLLEYGAEENILDKKGKSPSHYVRNPKEIDQNLLNVIPDAPRAGNNLPPSWDWSQLWGDGERAGRARLPPPPPALSNNGDSAFEDMGQEDLSDKQSPQITERPARRFLAHRGREEQELDHAYRHALFHCSIYFLYKTQWEP
ncbi:hypothetical protein J6590_003706, partial [Homalodisca vitripennis]